MTRQARQIIKKELGCNHTTRGNECTYNCCKEKWKQPLCIFCLFLFYLVFSLLTFLTFSLIFPHSLYIKSHQFCVLSLKLKKKQPAHHAQNILYSHNTKIGLTNNPTLFKRSQVTVNKTASWEFVYTVRKAEQ